MIARSRVPHVSVVVPTRDRLVLLEETVSSVLSQTYRDFELIVVDDASEDGTWAWLSGLKDTAMRAVRITHSERSAARNHGLAQAAAPFVLFLDDDDLLRPSALARLLGGFADHPDVVATVGAFVEFDDRGNRRRELHPHRRMRRRVWPDSIFSWRANPGRYVVRTELARAVGGFAPGLSIGEDLEFWLKVARRGPVELIPDVVLEVRRHAGQTAISDGPASVEEAAALHIASLSGAELESAHRMQAARRSYESSLDALANLDGRRAMRDLARAVRAEPRILRSPVARSRVTRAFAKTLVGVALGKRGLRATRRLIADARRITKRDAWRRSAPNGPGRAEERTPS